MSLDLVDHGHQHVEALKQAMNGWVTGLNGQFVFAILAQNHTQLQFYFDDFIGEDDMFFLEGTHPQNYLKIGDGLCDEFFSLVVPLAPA